MGRSGHGHVAKTDAHEHPCPDGSAVAMRGCGHVSGLAVAAVEADHLAALVAIWPHYGGHDSAVATGYGHEAGRSECGHGAMDGTGSDVVAGG